MTSKVASKALVLGIVHLLLQYFTTFFAIFFIDLAPDSLRAVSMIVARSAMDLLTFPMVRLVFPFTPLDTDEKIFVVFLANSILWTGCLYLLLRKITGLRQDRAKAR